MCFLRVIPMWSHGEQTFKANPHTLCKDTARPACFSYLRTQQRGASPFRSSGPVMRMETAASTCLELDLAMNHTTREFPAWPFYWPKKFEVGHLSYFCVQLASPLRHHPCLWYVAKMPQDDDAGAQNSSPQSTGVLTALRNGSSQ